VPDADYAVAPTYTLARTGSCHPHSVAHLRCSICGSLVEHDSTELHDAWHLHSGRPDGNGGGDA
jgi:hypothetical protein